MTGENKTGFERIPFDEVERELVRVLNKYAFDPEAANRCARLFAENTLDGVYSHGINRFPRFIKYVKEGYVRPNAKPEKKHRAGAIEQWDGCLGPGPLNALIATERSMALSKESGIGCVALSNTNHWMRGGAFRMEGGESRVCVHRLDEHDCEHAGVGSGGREIGK